SLLQMPRLSFFLFSVLLLSSFSSALSSVLRLDIGERTAKPFHNLDATEMMQDDSGPRVISSPFVSPLLAAWARPRRIAFKRYQGEN
ncbi:hypothetical protein PMAYCL1PPCAC_29928, partial [Pristionchus mayeri]